MQIIIVYAKDSNVNNTSEDDYYKSAEEDGCENMNESKSDVSKDEIGVAI